MLVIDVKSKDHSISMMFTVKYWCKHFEGCFKKRTTPQTFLTSLKPKIALSCILVYLSLHMANKVDKLPQIAKSLSAVFAALCFGATATTCQTVKGPIKANTGLSLSNGSRHCEKHLSRITFCPFCLGNSVSWNIPELQHFLNSF